MIQSSFVHVVIANPWLRKFLPPIIDRKATGASQALHQTSWQRRFLLLIFGKFRRRQRLIRPADRLEKLIPVIRINLGLLPPACQRHIGCALVGRRERFTGYADEDLVYR